MYDAGLFLAVWRSQSLGIKIPTVNISIAALGTCHVHLSPQDIFHMKKIQKLYAGGPLSREQLILLICLK